MNGQSAPGLDGFWFLDDRLTSGERRNVGRVPRGGNLAESVIRLQAYTDKDGDCMGFLDKLLKKKSAKPQQNTTAHSDVTLQPVTVPPSVTVKQTKRGIVNTYKVQIDSKAISNLKTRYIAFDVETTGLSSTGDRIVEIGAVLFENGEITERYDTLVNPRIPIPPAASAINNITNDMLTTAPQEDEVYANFVQFLGNSLNEQTAICAHNAQFDLGFLSETLMRLGYDAEIHYVDTLSLSRSLVKGLENYKQDTVAAHFDVANEQAHRAVSDAEACGKIFWKLLELKGEEQKQRQLYLEKSKPTSEEIEVCAFIQNSIVKNGGDTDWLGFVKDSSNYVAVSYLYSFLKIKFSKKGKYIIVEKSALKKMDFVVEPCTMSEGGSDYVRVYFDSPFELEPLTSYFFKSYKNCRKSALDYFSYSRRYEEEAKYSPAMMNALSDVEVEALLIAAEKRRAEDLIADVATGEKTANRPVFISRTDITINPVNDRVPLNNIRNLSDWHKGFNDGFQFWEQGDELRKAGNIEAAISLFDKARYNGYCAPVLFESYAMAYHKLGDYDNVIQILDEGIEREKGQGRSISRLEARRDKAVQLLHKQMETQKKILEKQEEAQQKVIAKKLAKSTPKKPVGRAILQLSDDMILIKRYETIADAVRETSISSKSIRDAAKGVQKHAGGFIWKYADEEK